MLESKVRLDGIRIPAFHGPKSLVQQAGTGGKSRFRPTDAVRPLFFGGSIQRGEGTQPFAPRILGPRRQQQAPLAAESPQQRIDEIGRTADHEGLGIARAHPAAMPDDLRRRCRQGTRQLHHDICRDVALFFGPLRRIGTHEVRQSFKILDITLHVGGIVELFFDQDMEHGQVEGQVRAGTDADILLCLETRHRGANVHTGQTAALVQRIHHLIELPYLEGFQQVTPLYDDMAAILEIIDPFAAPVTGQGIGGLIDVMGTGIIMGAVVGRAQAAHQGLAHVGERPGPLGPEHTARPVGGHDRFQPFRHIIQGLVPAHGTPLPCSALSGTNQRPLRAFVISIEG